MYLYLVFRYQTFEMRHPKYDAVMVEGRTHQQRMDMLPAGTYGWRVVLALSKQDAIILAHQQGV